MPAVGTNTGQQVERRLFLTMAELPQALAVCIRQRQPVCLHGGVGIGKTSGVSQVTARLDYTWQVVLTANKESTDLSGIPWTKPNDEDILETQWAVPSFVAHARKQAACAAAQGKTHIIFWDELNRADVSVLNVASQAILGDNFGDHHVDNLMHIAAVNDAADSAGVTAMPDQLRNRFLHLYVCADPAAWLLWARSTHSTLVSANAAVIIAYITNHPDHLHMPSRHADAFPTPRAWEFLSRVLDPTLPRAIENALIYGAIGPDVGQQFSAHLALYRSLAGRFDIVRIIAQPAVEPVPQGISEQYAVANALSLLCNAANADNIVTYLLRMPVEFQTFAVLGALRRTGTAPRQYQDSPLYQSGAVNKWIVAHADYF